MRMAEPTTPTRRAWLVLAVVSAAMLLVQVPFAHATAWHFFDDSARLLMGDTTTAIGPSGLSLYVSHPEFQFGPLSIVVGLPLSWLGTTAGSWAAMVALSVAGLVVYAALASAVVRLRPEAASRAGQRAVLVGGVVFVIVWSDVAVRTAHLDDAVAIAAAVTAVWALAAARPVFAVAALAVAGAAKPWGAVFAPLASAPQRGPRRWLWASFALGLAAVTWLPFVVADLRTLDTSEYGIANEASSALRALGFSEVMTPDWVRPAQLIGGLTLAVVLVARDRWSAVIMAGVAWRLLLDPAANRYYTVGLVAGLLVYELLRRPERLPWAAIVAAVLLELGQAEGFPPTLSGWLRVAVTLTVIVVAFVGPSSVPLPEYAPSSRETVNSRRGSPTDREHP